MKILSLILVLSSVFIVQLGYASADCGVEVASLSKFNHAILELAQLALGLEEADSSVPMHLILSKAFGEKSSEIEDLMTLAGMSESEKNNVKREFEAQLQTLKQSDHEKNQVLMELEKKVREKEDEIFKTTFVQTDRSRRRSEFPGKLFNLVSTDSFGYESFRAEALRLSKIHIEDVFKKTIKKQFYVTDFGTLEVMKTDASSTRAAIVGVKGDIRLRDIGKAESTLKYRLGVWDLNTSAPLNDVELPGDSGLPDLIQWSADGKVLTVPKSDYSGITIYDRDLKHKLETIKCGLGRNVRLHLTPDNKFIGLTHILEPDDISFGIWSLNSDFKATPVTLRPSMEFKRRMANNEIVLDLTFDPKNGLVYTATNRGLVDVWDLASGNYLENIVSESAEKFVRSVEILESGEVLLKYIKRIDQFELDVVRNGKIIASLDLSPNEHEYVKEAVTSPDGLWTALITGNRVTGTDLLRIRSVITGKEAFKTALNPASNMTKLHPLIASPVWNTDGSLLSVKVEDDVFIFKKSSNSSGEGKK